MNPVVKLLARAAHMYTCAEMCDLASDAMEHALSPQQRAWRRAHLLLCPGCRAFRRQLRVTVATVRAAAPAEPTKAPADLQNALAARLHEKSKKPL